MDRKRLIGKILMEKGWAIQSKGFQQFLPLGRPEILAEFYDEWQVDEIFLVEKSNNNQSSDFLKSTIKKLVEVCRTPLTVCGGIKDLKSALNLIQCGADRIAVNSAFLDDPTLASRLKGVIGRQAVVASVDFTMQAGVAQVYDYRIQGMNNLTVKDYCLQLVDAGVGEILLHSVDRDGSKQGYEVDLYYDLVHMLDIPIIASGGFGIPIHGKQVLDTGIQAFAIGNTLAYSEHAATTIKGSIKQGEEIRKTHIHYNRSQISDDGRLIKKDDDHLDSLRFKKREALWM